ncbi:MAG: hypothetical protein M1831_007167 [Alyxoria varia]|nr:MAG: hypothetical protein M1831_007167 [Alyxoria varia]
MAKCPNCGYNNFTGRSTCRQCGKTIPEFVSLDKSTPKEDPKPDPKPDPKQDPKTDSKEKK